MPSCMLQSGPTGRFHTRAVHRRCAAPEEHAPAVPCAIVFHNPHVILGRCLRRLVLQVEDVQSHGTSDQGPGYRSERAFDAPRKPSSPAREATRRKTVRGTKTAGFAIVGRRRTRSRRDRPRPLAGTLDWLLDRARCGRVCHPAGHPASQALPCAHPEPTAGQRPGVLVAGRPTKLPRDRSLVCATRAVPVRPPVGECPRAARRAVCRRHDRADGHGRQRMRTSQAPRVCATYTRLDGPGHRGARDPPCGGGARIFMT